MTLLVRTAHASHLGAISSNLFDAKHCQHHASATAVLFLIATACTSGNAPDAETAGGVSATGGTLAANATGGGASTPASDAGGINGSGGHQAASGGTSNTDTSTTGGVFSTTSGTAAGGSTATWLTDGRGGATVSGGHSNSGSTSSIGGSNPGATSATTLARTSGGALGSGGANATGGTSATGTTGRANGGTGPSIGGTTADAGIIAKSGPCDIFQTNGTPCVAAHSTVRALFGSYSGRLYQVRRSDNTTKDILTLTPGGFADGPAQDTFCSGTACVITVVYDQSENANDLWYQGSSVVPGSPQSSAARADTEPLTIGGHKVYSLYIKPGNSYWRDGSKSGVPTKTEPEGMYMVTSGKHVNGGCCFDYGNSETTRTADAAGAMDAINFSKQCWFGGCSGSGPWVQADLEWGLFPGGSQTWNPSQQAFPNQYVTAMLKNNGSTEFALKGGNAQSGALTTLYKGKLPSGYNPMKKQGAIILGSGGDCCKPSGGANLSEGTFYEGAIVSGYPTDAADEAVQSNIVAAGY